MICFFIWKLCTQFEPKHEPNYFVKSASTINHLLNQDTLEEASRSKISKRMCCKYFVYTYAAQIHFDREKHGSIKRERLVYSLAYFLVLQIVSPCPSLPFFKHRSYLGFKCKAAIKVKVQFPILWLEDLQRARSFLCIQNWNPLIFFITIYNDP